MDGGFGLNIPSRLAIHKTIWTSLVLGIVFVGIAMGVAGWSLLKVHRAPVIQAEHSVITLQVPIGSHFQGLVRELEHLGLVRSSMWWRLYGRVFNPVIQAGEYNFKGGESLASWLRKMANGEVSRHRFTIVEGWTLRQLRRALAETTRLVQQTQDWSDEQLMRALGCEHCPAEGAFLPETYVYQRGESDLLLLTRAHEAMESALHSAWVNRDPDLPLSEAKDLLILASLIEKETGVPEERGTIAGVFVRRLNLGMRLQTDPTVIYGLGETYNGNLTRADLRTDHPWNTYTRHGLPPTPIAMPGIASLEAASQPAPGAALYFVARGDGTHVFSETLEQHNRAVNRYIRGRK